jgi:hypothetical protein
LLPDEHDAVEVPIHVSVAGPGEGREARSKFGYRTVAIDGPVEVKRAGVKPLDERIFHSTTDVEIADYPI